MMKLRTILIFIIVGCILFSDLAMAEPRTKKQSEKGRKAIKILKLEVKSSTWREGKPYNIENAVRKKLIQAGFKVAGPETMEYDANLKVTYDEIKGYEYKSGNQSSLNGTDIFFIADLTDQRALTQGQSKVMIAERSPVYEDYNLQALKEMLDMEDGKKFSQITLRAIAFTSLFVSVPLGTSFETALYNDALKKFKQEYDFQYLGQIVAYALGDTAQSPVILKGLLDKMACRAMRFRLLLNSMNYLPKNDEERAMYAVAARDWNECIRIGKPAIKPVVILLDSNYRYDAAEVLGVIGDATIIPAFKKGGSQWINDKNYRKAAEDAIKKIMERERKGK